MFTAAALSGTDFWLYWKCVASACLLKRQNVYVWNLYIGGRLEYI